MNLPHPLRYSPRRAGLLLVLCGCLAAGAVPACKKDGEKSAEATGAGRDEADKGEGDPVPVEVAPLDTGPIESLLRFSVNLEAERQVQVLGRASGQVVKLAVEEGDQVDRGEVLLRLEDDEQRSALARVEHDLERASREHEKQKKMHERGLVSDQTLDNAAHEKKRLEIAVRDARRALRYTVVRAPIAGTVSRRMVKLGDFVKLQQPLFEVTDFDSLVARIFVPEKQIPALEEGLEARVRPQAEGSDAYAGEVERIAPVIDPASGTAKTTIALPKTEGLRPGMFVDVELVTDRRADALRLPKRALVYDDEEPFAFKLVDGEDGKEVERVRVEPELEDRSFVLPKSGFLRGDLVVVAGQVGLKDGARVKPRPAKEGEVEASARKATEDAAPGAGERVQ